MQSNKAKRLRTIGLIALTVAVIVVIVLTVYLTERCTPDPITADIGKWSELGDYDLIVERVAFETDAADPTKALATVTLSVRAHRKIKLHSDDFRINGEDCFSAPAPWESGALQLEQGQEQQMTLVWQVEANSSRQLVLEHRHLQVRLGSSMQV